MFEIVCFTEIGCRPVRRVTWKPSFHVTRLTGRPYMTYSVSRLKIGCLRYFEIVCFTAWNRVFAIFDIVCFTVWNQVFAMFEIVCFHCLKSCIRNVWNRVFAMFEIVCLRCLKSCVSLLEIGHVQTGYFVLQTAQRRSNGTPQRGVYCWGFPRGVESGPQGGRQRLEFCQCWPDADVVAKRDLASFSTARTRSQRRICGVGRRRLPDG